MTDYRMRWGRRQGGTALQPEKQKIEPPDPICFYAPIYIIGSADAKVANKIRFRQKIVTLIQNEVFDVQKQKNRSFSRPAPPITSKIIPNLSAVAV
ncbi:MAG: hypothetical protein V2A66_01980 [Pseudomonadota bacterium]